MTSGKPFRPRAGASPAEARGQGLDEQEAETAIIPSGEHIYLDDGFKPGWIYELIYEARDPRILGLGFVAVRDYLAFLRNEEDEAANPLAGSVEKIYGWGRSQAGRAIREFIYRGFNADAAGRRVFDGVMPHVSGAGRMWLNHRFANGSAMAGQQYEGHHNFADRFPFSYAETTDHLTGQHRYHSQTPINRSARHAYSKRNEILAAAWLARAHRHQRQ